ncbi:MAG: hypothetical protein ACI8RD_003122 [Bacillariaceae sp.]
MKKLKGGAHLKEELKLRSDSTSGIKAELLKGLKRALAKVFDWIYLKQEGQEERGNNKEET